MKSLCFDVCSARQCVTVAGAAAEEESLDRKALATQHYAINWFRFDLFLVFIRKTGCLCGFARAAHSKKKDGFLFIYTSSLLSLCYFLITDMCFFSFQT